MKLSIGEFKIESIEGRARTGLLSTKSGEFSTPAFMPVGTVGTVKGVSPRDLKELGAEIALVNTYHLHLRPGDELVRDLGGIHKFCGWSGPILSDSGGYQVFSLSKLRDISEEGVRFRSHLDGAMIELTPEKVVRIQENLNVDIMMVLDECLNKETSEKAALDSWKRTLRWAKRAKAAHVNKNILMFGIAQGGMFPELRRLSSEELVQEGFNGYAIGGLSVGEPTEVMREMTEHSVVNLPENKVRYLMGVGTPWDIVDSVYMGIDMFDCVVPTRNARFGRLFLNDGWINIRNSKFRKDSAPIDSSCECYACRNFSRAYISHLIHANEMLGPQLGSIHNLYFFQRLMRTIRRHIAEKTFSAFRNQYIPQWQDFLKSQESSHEI